MLKIIALPNRAKTGFSIPSELNRAKLQDWFKKYPAFDITPRISDSIKGRGYLEGAVIPAYCEFQYDINPKETGKSEQRRMLFKQDFNSEIIKDRQGKPVKVPRTSKGKVKDLTQKYTDWAEKNGAPIPNPALFELWRDEWNSDPRFPTFFDFLDFLKLDVDAMPSVETLRKLKIDTAPVPYPEEQNEGIDTEKVPW